MMRFLLSMLIMLLFFPAQSAWAGEISDSGRFCGYSVIIDLQDGETISTIDGGIHSGTFNWKGSFGELLVMNSEISSPDDAPLLKHNSFGHGIYDLGLVEAEYTLAIWNGKSAAAFFYSDTPYTQEQIEAIERVDLFDETIGRPENCNLSTVFHWGY